MNGEDLPVAKIRRSIASDEPAILALVHRLVAFGPPPWRDPASMVLVDVGIVRDALRANSDDPAVFVAVVETEVAGFVYVKSATDPYRSRPHGHVSDLVVAEEREGQGIAGRLLLEAEAWSRERGYDWLTISVFDKNHRAADLYDRYGFRRDIVRLVKPLD